MILVKKIQQSISFFVNFHHHIFYEHYWIFLSIKWIINFLLENMFVYDLVFLMLKNFHCDDNSQWYIFHFDVFIKKKMESHMSCKKEFNRTIMDFLWWNQNIKTLKHFEYNSKNCLFMSIKKNYSNELTI